MRTAMFTGHRNMDAWAITPKLIRTIEALYDRGVTDFVAGGALGFDTVAALRVLAFREHHPDVRLFLALPCMNQTENWSKKDIDIYNLILERSNGVHFTEKRYTSGCMHARNRFMVDISDVCVCFMNKDRGGTAYTVNYARKQNLPVLNLADESLKIEDFIRNM